MSKQGEPSVITEMKRIFREYVWPGLVMAGIAFGLCNLYIEWTDMEMERAARMRDEGVAP